MYIDAQQLFSDSQALVATAVSTNVIDLGSDRDIGIGEPLAVVVVVKVAADRTTGDETYTVTVQADDNVGFATPSTVAGPVSLLIYPAGTKLVIPLPPDKTTERFLRLNYTLGGTTPTVTLSAFLTRMNMIQAENYYNDAITIS